MPKKTLRKSAKKPSARKSPAKKAARPSARKAAAKAAPRRPRAVRAAAKLGKLVRPKVLRNKRDSFVLVLTDRPDRVDGWELAQRFYRGHEGAGDILPPNGLGARHFDQDLMDETSGDVPIATCRAGLAELREIVSRSVDALGFEKQGVLYALSEAEFLEAVQHGKWKFVKFVHLEDE
jgi:hypothetical protein